MPFEPGYFPTLEDSLVETLTKMYDDTDDWIYWWVYETEFGQYHTDITTKEGIRYVIGTSKDLYYILNGEWDKLEHCPV